MSALDRRWIPPAALDVTWVGMLLVAAPHHERLPGWFWLLFPVCVLIARAVIAGRASAPHRWLLALPIAAMVGALFHDFDSLLNPEGGTAFLLVAFCGKLLEARTLREARVLHLLMLFVAPLQLLFDTSIGAALMAVAGMMCALAAMTMTQPSLPGVKPWWAIRVAVLALLQAVPVMVVLFVFFPRLAPLWNLPKPGAEPAVGFSEDMDLSGLGSLNDNPAIAFRVKFQDLQPASSDLYWRMLVLDSLDGEKWSWRKGPASVVPEGDPGVDLAYTVFPEPGVLGYVPHLDPVRSPSGRSFRQWEGSVIPLQDRQSREPWLLLRAERDGDSDVAVKLPSGESPVLPHVWSLPEGVAPRSRALARAWRKQGAHTPELVVKRFWEWTDANAFSYSLNPPAANGDRTDAFLFEQKQGYCSHYASALAVILRETGTPARLVTGFQGGEFNAGGDYWIVRQSDAHAWVEYLSADGFWHRVDPTAFVAPERVRLGSRIHQRSLDLFGLELTNPRYWSVFNRLEKAVDYLNYQWITKVVAYDAARQESLFERLPDIGFVQGRVAFLVTAVAGVLVITLVFILKPWQLRRRLPEDRMLQHLLTTAAHRFRPRPAGETPLAYARSLAVSAPAAGQALTAFLNAHHERVYGPSSGVPGSYIASQTGLQSTVRLKALYRHCLRTLRSSGARGFRAR